MNLFPLLQPDLVLGGSVLDLTPEILTRYKIDGLVLDVDDTIVPIGSSLAEPALILWIEQTRQLVPVWLVTNNPNQVRIGAIAASLSLPYFLSAAKPSRKKLRQAVAAMSMEPARVAMVGDRVFTDVLAGNRMGMFTILIEPMVGAESILSFSLLRRIEFAIASFLYHQEISLDGDVYAIEPMVGAESILSFSLLADRVAIARLLGVSFTIKK